MCRQVADDRRSGEVSGERNTPRVDRCVSAEYGKSETMKIF